MSKELMLKNISAAEDQIALKKDETTKKSSRQHYHFMGQTGWINDPNGLIFYKGKYHYFYQCNPYDSFWGAMHWGHAVSEDLLKWEYLPIALAPSQECDFHPKGGCFSGTAIERDGILYVMYTAQSNTGKGDIQCQCVAWSEDGIHFTKYEGNPVIMPPEWILQNEFRDPKVWKHEDYYYMICGANKHGRSEVLIYRSEDFLHWDFFNVLYESRGEWGRMWECPDLFQLEDKFVLTGSPVASGDHTAVYLVGDFDYKTGKFLPQTSEEIDWGLDYYAPQSFMTPDGRRIAVAWANRWEWMPQFRDWGPTFRDGWCGYFNLPREIKLTEDNKLQYIPIRELQNLRTDAYRQETISLSEEPVELKAGDGVSCELRFDIDLTQTGAEQIEIWLRQGEGKKTVCLLDLMKGEMTVDCREADGWSEGVSRSILFLKNKQSLDLHIFLDQCSIEIFTDQYKHNHSNSVFGTNEQNKILVKTHGGNAVLKNYESYGLNDCFR